MKVLNFGSLNIDHVYQVAHFVQPGETLGAEAYCKNAGGKGLNQSIALARAGAEVYHAGQIGKDGLFLKELLEQEGIDTRFLKVAEEEPTGHAVIQVDTQGQNSILIFGGANAAVSEQDMKRVFAGFAAGDLVIFQNEIAGLPQMLKFAAQAGLRIALNPSPINEALSVSDLTLVHYFIMNEIEGAAITGKHEPIEILDEMHRLYPKAGVVLTLGAQGACYGDGSTYVFEEARTVKVADTTAAGDTFTGYFLAALLNGFSPAAALRKATDAAAIAVSRTGAACSIPRWDEVK
ncbi:MAG: ribokinase [Clostridiales bacterium]|nr:MAG: ribokinase [Clostridiales bacterium]